MATQLGCRSQPFTALLKMHCTQNLIFFAKFTSYMQHKLKKRRPCSWHLNICLNFDEWKTFVTTDEAMFNLGGSYGRL